MEAKLEQMRREKRVRMAAAAPEQPDIAALAKLIADGTQEPVDSAPTIVEFLKRAGFTHPFATKLLETGAQASAPHVIRLAALHLHLERARLWNDATRKAVRQLERQFARALTPSQYQNNGTEFDVPIRLRKGRYRSDQAASIAAAEKEIATLAQEMGVADLSDKAVLDIGCGVKFTQAFYGRGIPVKQYHGVDVDGAMIEFLSSNVFNDKFSYKHIDVYNEMYNKRGDALSPDTDIGAAGREFDLICLFSVFTHLAPTDYVAMLRLARKYIAPNGKLIYTTCIDEQITEKFKDTFKDQPLLKAVYREDAVREMLASAKWAPTRLFKLGAAKTWDVCEPC
jgi:2-polyprenyl-3-methyl-5-hydroxy-6-metoxy-1,4-benzoquinol methylase